MEGWTILLTAPLAAVAAVFLFRTWQSVPAGPPGPFGLPDAVVSSLLTLWFLSLVAGASGEPQQITTATIAGSAVVYGGLVVMLSTLLTLRGVPLSEAFLLKRGGPGTWRLVALSAASAIPLVLFTQSLVSWFLPDSAGSQPILEFWTQHGDLTGRVLVVLMASIVAPVCEEWIFRGYLYGTAKRFVGPLWAMLAVSLLFAAIHLHLPAMPGLFLLGVLFTVVYERAGTLWAPIVVHSAFNSISLTASLLWPDAA